MSQFVPCTTIIIPSVSITADAVETVSPHRATTTIQCSGPSIATACKNAPGLKLPPMRSQHVSASDTQSADS
ncbi:hypothetical protein ACYCVF_35895 [Bradyrhizobium sp. 1.29L]